MKKIISSFLFLITIASLSFAEIAKSRFKITENIQEFDIKYIFTRDMQQIETQENPDISVFTAFKIKKGNEEGELRYSLFTDINETDFTNAKMQAYIWSLMCAKNMAGYDFPSNKLTQYGDNDVKGEFNGDYGFNAYITNPKSKYAEDYNYIYADFFYKKGQGLVVRAFLFKDISFVGLNSDGTVREDSALFTNYDSFKFYDSKELYPANMKNDKWYKDVDSKYIGTYIPENFDKKLKQTKLLYESMADNSEKHHDVLFLGKNRCYSELKFHDRYAIKAVDFENYKFGTDKIGLYCIDERGNVYRKISDSLDKYGYGYEAYESYVLKVLFDSAKEIKLEGCKIIFDGKEYELLLDCIFFYETKGVVAWIYDKERELYGLKKNGDNIEIYKSRRGVAGYVDDGYILGEKLSKVITFE